MRKIIAALQVSLDGFIDGPNEELDWVDSWEDPFDVVGKVDAFILGARMYPGYEQYWQAVLDNPRSILPFTGRPRPKGRSNMPSSPAGRPTLSCRARSRPSRGSTRESFAISRTFAD
jgi:hypothetical protein